MCQTHFLSQFFLCASICGMSNFLFCWILYHTMCSWIVQRSASNALSHSCQSLPSCQSFFHMAYKCFETFLSPIFHENDVSFDVTPISHCWYTTSSKYCKHNPFLYARWSCTTYLAKWYKAEGANHFLFLCLEYFIKTSDAPLRHKVVAWKTSDANVPLILQWSIWDCL